MKALFFSDLHAHNWSQYSTRLSNGLNSRLNDCIDIIRQAAKACKTYGVDHVFFLGDLFESRKSLDIDVFSEVHKEIVELSKCVSQHVWLLVGNHDQHTKIGDVHSIQIFRHLQKVVVIDKPWVCLPIGGASIAAFPHMSDVTDLKSRLSNITDVDVVLIHQALREGTIGPYARTIAAELSVSDLPLSKCRYVLAGDYHRRQTIATNGAPVHYIGSPLQLKADEVGEEKGFTLLDTSDWQLYTIPTVYPKFHLFNDPSELSAALEADENTIDPEYDFIRVKYTSDAEKSAENLKASYPRIQIEEVVEQRSLARTAASAVDSDYLLCREYVDQRGQDFDEDMLLTIAMELLEGE